MAAWGQEDPSKSNTNQQRSKNIQENPSWDKKNHLNRHGPGGLRASAGAGCGCWCWRSAAEAPRKRPGGRHSSGKSDFIQHYHHHHHHHREGVVYISFCLNSHICSLRNCFQEVVVYKIYLSILLCPSLSTNRCKRGPGLLVRCPYVLTNPDDMNVIVRSKRVTMTRLQLFQLSTMYCLLRYHHFEISLSSGYDMWPIRAPRILSGWISPKLMGVSIVT